MSLKSWVERLSGSLKWIWRGRSLNGSLERPLLELLEDRGSLPSAIFTELRMRMVVGQCTADLKYKCEPLMDITWIQITFQSLNQVAIRTANFEILPAKHPNFL